MVATVGEVAGTTDRGRGRCYLGNLSFTMACSFSHWTHVRAHSLEFDSTVVLHFTNKIND